MIKWLVQFNDDDFELKDRLRFVRPSILDENECCLLWYKKLSASSCDWIDELADIGNILLNQNMFSISLYGFVLTVVIRYGIVLKKQLVRLFC